MLQIKKDQDHTTLFIQQGEYGEGIENIYERQKNFKPICSKTNMKIWILVLMKKIKDNQQHQILTEYQLG